MKKLMAFVFCLLSASILSPKAAAADVHPYFANSGKFRAIVIEGNIEPGDFETFLRIIRENQGQISSVFILSPGGNFYEAMKIGRAMRALELGSQVPMRTPSGRPSCEDVMLGIKPKDPKNCTCASAGFFIHIGGVHRGGTFLSVHRPYFEQGSFGKLSQVDAKKAFDTLQEKARKYMQEMGVPQHIQEDVLGTPSDRALILDEKTVKTYFWLELPYRHEWLMNKCSKLSALEKGRLADYSRRLLMARSASDAGLAKSDLADLQTLQKMEEEEDGCTIEANRQSRVEAYQKYFGEAPNDYGSQNFSKWSESTKYLGRRFYDLMAEEKFEEERFAKSIFLNRAATANAPYISVSDSLSSPKVVTWVNLISLPNPSPEFTRRLVKSLENAWGKRSAGNGTSEWLWDKAYFSAKLSYDSESSKEAYLGLIIDAK